MSQNQLAGQLKHPQNPSSLTANQSQQLHQAGYLLLPKLIQTDWLKRLQTAFEALYQQNREAGSRKKGTRHVEGWRQYDEELVEPLYRHPLLQAAARQVIGRPFALGQLHGREPLKGYGAQGLHADWGIDGDPKQSHSLTSLWLLDEMTAENGATRLVPGTQMQRNLPRKGIGPADCHPDEILLNAPAGSVLMFNGHLWHGGSRNQSGAARRVIQCTLVAQEFTWLVARS